MRCPQIPNQSPTQKVFFHWLTQNVCTMRQSHCETVPDKELIQWLFLELAHSLCKLPSLLIQMGWHKNQMVSLRRTSDGSHWIYTKAQFSVGFETKIKLKVNVNQAQNNRNLSSAKMHFDPNLDILTSVEGELWREQTQNRVNFYLHYLNYLRLNLTLKVRVNNPTKH